MILALLACGSNWPGAVPSERVSPDPRLGWVVSEDRPFRFLEVWGSSAAEGGFILVRLGRGYDGDVLDAPEEIRAYVVGTSGVTDIAAPFDPTSSIQTAWALGGAGAVVTYTDSDAEVHAYGGSWQSTALPPDVFQPGDTVFASPDGGVIVQSEEAIWARSAATAWQQLLPTQGNTFSTSVGGWSPEGFVLISTSPERLCAEDIDAVDLVHSNERCIDTLGYQELVGSAMNGSSAGGFTAMSLDGANVDAKRLYDIHPERIDRGDSLVADRLWPTPGSEHAIAVMDDAGPQQLPTLHMLVGGAVETVAALPSMNMTSNCTCDRDLDATCDCIAQDLRSVITTVTDDAALWVSVDAVDGRRNVRAKWLALPLTEHPVFDDCPASCPAACERVFREDESPTCIELPDIPDPFPIHVDVGLSFVSEPDEVPVITVLTEGQAPREVTGALRVSVDGTHTLEVTGPHYDTYTIGPFTSGGLGTSVLLDDYRFTRGIRIGDPEPFASNRATTAVHPATHTMLASAYGWKRITDAGAGPEVLDLTVGSQGIAGVTPMPQFSPSGTFVVTGGWTGQGWDVVSGAQLFSVNMDVLPRLTQFSQDESRVMLQTTPSVDGPHIGETLVVDVLTNTVTLQAPSGSGASMSGDGAFLSRIEGGSVVLYDVAAGTSETLAGFPVFDEHAITQVTDEGRVVVHQLLWGPALSCDDFTPCEVWVGSSQQAATPLGTPAHHVFTSRVGETAITIRNGELTHHDLSSGMDTVISSVGGMSAGRAGGLIVSAGEVFGVNQSSRLAVVDLADGALLLSENQGFEEVLQLQDGTCIAGLNLLVRPDGSTQAVSSLQFGIDNTQSTGVNGTDLVLANDPATLELITDGFVLATATNLYNQSSSTGIHRPYGAPCLVYRRDDTLGTPSPVDGGMFCAWTH